MRLAVWLLIGLAIYFTYSTKHSELRGGAGATAPPAARRSEAHS
jgi:hypothetical protein